ncbi:MAG: hypothetical protein K2L08_00455 [Erysipelotrichaceae bacterium]|nr:hypothetical protein [Erysipelotrichaceae bacterium]
MKRLLVDIIFIFILIYLGTHISKQDSNHMDQTIEDKITNFEDMVAQKKEIESQIEARSLNEIHENSASKMAKGASEFIVDVIDTSMQIISEIYKGITK